MDTLKPKSAFNNNNNNKSKLARTFQKVINLKTASKIASNNGICMLNPQSCRVVREKDDDELQRYNNSYGSKQFTEDLKSRNRAVMEALVAKLFAGITSIKAAYAELQMAQNPYNSDLIQASDQAVVDELKAISELKRSFLKKELDLSPQVTIMLAEIQEQQAVMKTYEITIKKLESEVDKKDSEISFLRKSVEEAVLINRTMEKKLNASGSLSAFDNIKLSSLTQTHFSQFLQGCLRSVRNFVKLLVREMESANWDLDLAVKFIEPNCCFSTKNHRCFAFESFVSKTIFEGFNFPTFNLENDSKIIGECNSQSEIFFDKFKKLRPVSPKHLFTQNPNSSFGKFLRVKYTQLVHAKMECSVFGNLNQRKMVTSCGYPETPFFNAFAEMAKRVWLLHCLAFSFGEEVMVFQVRKESRFSEVYMECVTQDVLFSSSSGELDDASPEADPRVGFTVVPGFKIGKMVFQSQVYLSPATSSPAS